MHSLHFSCPTVLIYLYCIYLLVLFYRFSTRTARVCQSFHSQEGKRMNQKAMTSQALNRCVVSHSEIGKASVLNLYMIVHI